MAFVAENDRLWATLDGIVADEGVRLYDLETMGSGGLRVTIERPKGEPTSLEAVTSGDCSKVCRRLMVYFQAEGQTLGFGAEPQIEVSSPGINRTLRLERHFVNAVGERVKVVLGSDGSEGTRTVIGTLKEAALPKLVVEDEQSGEAVEFPKSAVRKAAVDFKF